jgi:hypothetical protein
MVESLFHYERIQPATWVYLSSLLTIGLYFKFSRIWSVRNVDLVLLILLAPGLLMYLYGRQQQLDALEGSANRNGPARAAAAPWRPPTSEDFANHFESFYTSQLSNDEEGIDDAFADDLAAESLDDIGPAGATGNSTGDATGDESGDESARPATVSRPPPDRRKVDGAAIEWWGFVWLFCIGGVWLVRLLLDPTMVRRPLLEPNLTVGGMAFLGVSLFAFLTANVIVSRPEPQDLAGPQSAMRLLSRGADEANDPAERGEDDRPVESFGPGLSLIFMLPSISTMTFGDGKLADNVASGGSVGGGPTSEAARQTLESNNRSVVMAKTMAIVSHLAIAVGMVLIGYRHFDNPKMGFGAATLYLMLPYTAQMAGRVNHALLAALLVWAVLCYRRPLASGLFLGLAAGILYYPLFLLPLWISFYWQRGLGRFLAGVGAMVALVLISLLFVSPSADGYWSQVQGMFGLWEPGMSNLKGVWAVWDSVFRLPILAAFVAMSASLAIWPPQKNLGTLLSCSAALMVAAQFWHRDEGGVYMAWYLPLALLTVFRPNLEDRVALTVLGEGRFSRSKSRTRGAQRRAA